MALRFTIDTLEGSLPAGRFGRNLAIVVLPVVLAALLSVATTAASPEGWMIHQRYECLDVPGARSLPACRALEPGLLEGPWPDGDRWREARVRMDCGGAVHAPEAERWGVGGFGNPASTDFLEFARDVARLDPDAMPACSAPVARDAAWAEWIALERLREQEYRARVAEEMRPLPDPAVRTWIALIAATLLAWLLVPLVLAARLRSFREVPVSLTSAHLVLDGTVFPLSTIRSVEVVDGRLRVERTSGAVIRSAPLADSPELRTLLETYGALDRERHAEPDPSVMRGIDALRSARQRE